MVENHPAREWFGHACRDLEEAQLLRQHDFYPEKIGFSLHQAVEKFLKTLVAFQGLAVPKIHTLPALFRQVETFFDSDAFLTLCLRLDKYYIPSRYPVTAPFDASMEEVSNHLVATIALKKTVEEIIQTP